MNLSNWKIGARLGLGFALVVLLMVVVAFVGITRLSSLNQGTEIIVKDRMVKLEMANDVIEQINLIARSSRNILLMSDPAQVKQEFDRIAEARKKAVAILDDLGKKLNTEKGKAMHKTVMEVRAPYAEITMRFLKLAEEGKKEEALKILLNDVRPKQLAYLDALDKFQEYLKGMMNTAAEDAHDQYAMARIIMIGLTLAAVVIGGLIAFLVTRSITGPLNEAVRVAQSVAAGDLTSHIQVDRRDETGMLLQALKDMEASLVKIVGQIRTGSDTIATASAQIASGNMDLSSRTEEQASSLEETASSMEELTSTVKQNAENARQANQLAVAASEVAVKGGSVVSQVVETMTAIDASSKKMADIISVIDGIAFQTNILALNAAVEAARAGEQGRGFAVVASEVRNLAQRSASAAREIKALIDDSVGKVESGSKLVGEAGATMQEVVSSIRRVNDIMSEITAASAEQSAGIEQVNQAVVQMDTVTQQNAALVEESAAAAESLQDQATHLVQVVSVFKTGEGHGTAPASSAARTTAKPAASAPSLPAVRKPSLPQPQPQRKRVANAQSGDEWEEF